MKRVFLIDDDEDDREIFLSALNSLKLELNFTEAKDGREGLDMIASPGFTPPDIIFVDLNMPKVNGLEFLRSVRILPHYKELPIFIYSTSSIQEEKNKCMTAGASGFIVKHCCYTDLCDELKKLFEVY